MPPSAPPYFNGVNDPKIILQDLKCVHLLVILWWLHYCFSKLVSYTLTVRWNKVFVTYCNNCLLHIFLKVLFKDIISHQYNLVQCLGSLVTVLPNLSWALVKFRITPTGFSQLWTFIWKKVQCVSCLYATGVLVSLLIIILLQQSLSHWKRKCLMSVVIFDQWCKQSCINKITNHIWSPELIYQDWFLPFLELRAFKNPNIIYSNLTLCLCTVWY